MNEIGYPVCCRADRIVSELGSCIDYLFADPCMNNRYSLYCLMKCKLDELHFLNGLICSVNQQQSIVSWTQPQQANNIKTQTIPHKNQAAPQTMPQTVAYGMQLPVGQTTVPQQTTFTLEQLAQYNGKNGKPAYVAVNGTVYDVTDNAGWAAATHFGLSAGKDLSGEFASCHPGQPLLNRLKVIGRLVS